MAKYDVCKGGGVQENQTNADKGGGGGQKTGKFCRHHLSMAPLREGLARMATEDLGRKKKQDRHHTNFT